MSLSVLNQSLGSKLLNPAVKTSLSDKTTLDEKACSRCS
ncbi:Uncharacterised protein [Vibrio cholerae]|nr:Uncharacterised protein [Vibrio cholerae]